MCADVCKNLCDVRFGAGKVGTAAAPGIVKKAIDKLGNLISKI